MLPELLRDFRHAARSLRRQPGFTFIAILTLAVGIGATTTIFSVVDSTLLRPLPYHQTDRLMQVLVKVPAMFGMPPQEQPVWSFPKYQTLKEYQQVFDEMAAFGTFAEAKAVRAGGAEFLSGEYTEAAYFRLLGVPVEHGRTFTPQEDTAAGSRQVMVVSHRFWQDRLGSRPGAVGEEFLLDGRPHTIVGVLGPGFRGLGGRADYWLPAGAAPEWARKPRWNHNWQILARRKLGVSEAQAQAATVVLGRQVDAAHPFPGAPVAWSAAAKSLDALRMEPAARKAVWIFFGAVGFVLLVACANVTNLLLARGAARRREMAIRQAIGAGRARLVRYLGCESALLAAGGALGGLLLARLGVGLLNGLDVAGDNPLFAKLQGLTLVGLASIRLDSRVLLFACSIAGLACLLAGLAPALRASRLAVVEGLKADGSGAGSRHGLGRWLADTRLVVVSEVAVAVVLVAGASLMLRSFSRLLAIDTGIDPRNLLTVQIATERPRFFEDLEPRVAALPGVLSVGARDSFPLSSCCSNTQIWFPERGSTLETATLLVAPQFVSLDYFKTARIPLLQGRLFTGADREGRPKVAVISQMAARRFWPGVNPIGRRLFAGGSGDFGGGAEIIGIVGDARGQRPGEPELPIVYGSVLQYPDRLSTLYVRTAQNPALWMTAIREAIQQVDRGAVILDMKTMSERIADGGSKARIGTVLLGIFAIIGLVLTAIGLYGVMACSVSQRMREMGIRMALGAQPGSLVATELRRGLGLTLAGLALGIPAALALTRLLASLLYEVKPGDPAAHIVTAAVLIAVALLACYLPARRAASADALVTLRAE
jgi:putative ABC transport system permease protein